MIQIVPINNVSHIHNVFYINFHNVVRMQQHKQIRIQNKPINNMFNIHLYCNEMNLQQRNHHLFVPIQTNN